MELVVDASAILSVILGEPEADSVKRATVDACLYAPACMEYEMGNALSVLVKRRVLSAQQAVEAYSEYEKVPLYFLSIEMVQALSLACSEEIYAYDAYYLFCAKRLNVPLLTLDRKLAAVARSCSVAVCPVDGVDYL